MSSIFSKIVGVSSIVFMLILIMFPKQAGIVVTIPVVVIKAVLRYV